MKNIICGLIFLGIAPIAFAESEISQLTVQEKALFNEIKKGDEHFYFTTTVRRHFEKSESGRPRKETFIEVVFDKNSPEYKDKYASYTVDFFPDENIVHYSFFAGNAWNGEGTYTVLGHHVAQVERGCGTSACSIYTYIDGKELKEVSVENE